MANAFAITLHASGAETISGTGTVVDIHDVGGTNEGVRSCVQLDLVVTAVAGTLPTLAVVIETAPTATGPWRTGGTFSTVSAVGKSQKTIADLDRYVRASWTITGTTPSFTFSLSGYAHQLYCEPSDLSKTGINAAALASISSDVQAECCLNATADGETALNSSYELPITSWGADLRGHCARRAVFYAMCHRGFNPSSDADQLILLNGGHALIDGRKSSAQMYFDAVANGRLKPVGIVDQTPDEYEGSGFVISDAQR